MAEEYDLEQIENYIELRMENEEQVVFEKELAKNDALNNEVLIYRQLINGLTTLSSEAFRKKMQTWEEENDYTRFDDSELISWYLNNRLNEEGVSLVEKRAAQYPEFAETLRKQKLLENGFLALKSETFAEKITGWEKDSKQSSKPTMAHRIFLLRRVAAACLLILATIAIYWYGNTNYSRTSITGNLYTSYQSEAIMGESQVGASMIESNIQEAHALMESKNYEAAFLAFNQILETINQAELDDFNKLYYTEQAKWNRLLAAQTFDSPPLDVQEEVIRIAAKDGHTFQNEAQLLKEQMNTLWYKIFN